MNCFIMRIGKKVITLFCELYGRHFTFFTSQQSQEWKNRRDFPVRKSLGHKKWLGSSERENHKKNLFHRTRVCWTKFLTLMGLFEGQLRIIRNQWFYHQMGWVCDKPFAKPRKFFYQSTILTIFLSFFPQKSIINLLGATGRNQATIVSVKHRALRIGRRYQRLWR